MARRIKIVLLFLVFGGVVVFVLGEGYFYFVVLRPGVQHMVESAGKGDPEVQLELAVLYEVPGKFFPAITADPAKAAFWYRKAAEQGNSRAEVLLSLLYAGGKGVRQDNAEAVRWMRLGAEHGNADGQMMLGRMYDKGYNGVSRDDVKAAEWYRRAATQGQAVAQRLLGDCYANGRGVQKDDVQADAWYRKAAAQGDTEAQRHGAR